MAIDKSLMSGSMTMLVLRLLAEKDMYGYEMIDTLRKKSCNVFELKAGTCIRYCMDWRRKVCLTYMSRNMQERRGSITVSRKRDGLCWLRSRKNGRNISPQ